MSGLMLICVNLDRLIAVTIPLASFGSSNVEGVHLLQTYYTFTWRYAVLLNTPFFLVGFAIWIVSYVISYVDTMSGKFANMNAISVQCYTEQTVNDANINYYTVMLFKENLKLILESRTLSQI